MGGGAGLLQHRVHQPRASLAHRAGVSCGSTRLVSKVVRLVGVSLAIPVFGPEPERTVATRKIGLNHGLEAAAARIAALAFLLITAACAVSPTAPSTEGAGLDKWD